MAVHGHSACTQRNEAVHEPSNKHAAPTELEKDPLCVGGYRDGAPTELFKLRRRFGKKMDGKKISELSRI
jgi:hypothetical protein